MKKEKLNIWQKIGLLFFDKRLLTISTWALAVIFGLVSYTSLMRKEGFPSVNVPLGVVRVVSFADNAEVLDKSFTKPIVDSARLDTLTKEVISTTTDQGASIRIAYKDDTDVQKALDDLRSRVNDSLPKNGQVIYIKVIANKLTAEGDDLLISVHAKDKTGQELETIGKTVADIIKNKVPLAKETRVFKLYETDTTNQENSARQVRFDRYFDKENNEILSSVPVGVTGIDGVDQIELYDQVLSVLQTKEIKDTGADAKIAVTFAENIKEQVSGLQRNLLEGLIAVLIVSFILISLRGSVVTALAMTTTVLITVGVLQLIGYTINTITLFSLVLSLALIVDDTTIIVESIDAGLKKGKKFRDVVAESLKKVVRASATGTFATALAFAPMLFIGGLLGEFIRAIPVTIIISLLVSLVVSFVFIPLFMRISYGKEIETLGRRIGFATKLESSLGQKLSNILNWSIKTRARSISTKLHALLIVAVFIFGGLMIFKKVEFSIFPSPKDGKQIAVVVLNKTGADTLIESSQNTADSMLNDIKEIGGTDIERMSLMGQNGLGNREGFGVSVTLNGFNKRDRSSVELAKQIQDTLEKKYPDQKIIAESSGVGPPAGNFTVQVKSDNVAASTKLSNEIKAYLEQLTLVRADKTTATLKDVTVTLPASVARDNGDRVVNITADFSDKDVSALVLIAEKSVRDRFNAETVRSYGLESEALQFNFGQEEENQKSFESMGRAAGPLFLSMIILMAILFKSILQPLLILMALPFAFFGVASGLYLTNNAISFFTMLGVFALIGISLNNTILLTDYANQARNEGKTPVEAMSSALKARIRPLLTTSITSILALLPLALNDPFWEGLAFTLIFGLISSTVLVILVFPYFYLIEESIRSKIRHLFGR
jgi:multidrug efflux pump subunit AcrB